MPFRPFVDVVGKVGTVPPVQMVRLLPKLNVGMVFAVIVTSSVTVAGITHCPAVGVKV